MVEYNVYLNGLFGSLADPIRRDILKRLIDARYTVSQLAQNYEVSFAAVAKHLKVLEQARLITKTRHGNEQIVEIAPSALHDIAEYIKPYEELWSKRYDSIDKLLKENV